MNVYITKLNGIGNTMQFMQHMTTEIAHQLGFREMGIYFYNANAEGIHERSVRFDGLIAGMSPGDIVICQFHTWNGLKFERGLVDRIKAYHGRVVIFIHSLEALMIKSSRFMLEEAIELFNQAEVLIVPSYEMKRFLLNPGIRVGIRTGMKFVVQEMWDYTTDICFQRTPKLEREINYGGSSDMPFVNGWKYKIPLKLYTSMTIEEQNVYSIGQMNPDELLIELSKGGFGLEWYQNEYMYQYMRYGNSFLVSKYLAAGIPVIVPDGISSQKLIEENHLGLVVNSLDEAVEAVASMEESEYQEYVRHVNQFAPALRNGYYTKKCLIESVQALFREDIGRAYMHSADIYDACDYAIIVVALNKSYGGNLALSWEVDEKPDGFLVYDSAGKLVEEIKDVYQHYFLIKEDDKEKEFVIKAYVNTQKGKMIVAKSSLICVTEKVKINPLVSIVIPVYNAEAYIVRSIDTVLAQSFSDIEIIIIDDGSTDHTPDIIDWYADNYANIIRIHQKNAGVQAARNTGIAYATGEYIGFVDSDDMIRPNMVEKMYASAQINHCDIVISSGYRIESKGYVPIMEYPMKENVAITVEEFLQMYIVDGYALPAVWNKLYRASLVKQFPFPEIKFEDEAWTPYILSYAEKICFLKKGFYEYDRSRSTCSDSLVNQWLWKSKEQVFEDHKNSIMFYLKYGNPERVELLKKLAKSELAAFAKITSYVEYGELKKQIEEM